MASSRSNRPRRSKGPSGLSPAKTVYPSTKRLRSYSYSPSTVADVARIRVQLLLLPEVKAAAERAARELAAERQQSYSMGRYIEDAVVTRLRREKRLPAPNGGQDA